MDKNFMKPKLLIGLCTMSCIGYASAMAAIPTAGITVVNQQNLKKIKGTVVDENGPIIGATIREVGTTRATITDFDGNFSMDVASGAQLEITYVGMKAQVVKVGSQSTFNITMTSDSKILEDVVVVGYGVQKKKLVTGATVQVKGDDVSRLNTVSALGALQSQTPGVNIVASNGMPGEGYKVNIRGIGTVGESAPLYVIDGVAGGDINTLNPADIESIDVLKDAASAAIYGSRAANGVILVTTKQGKEGKMQVSYDMYYGWQNVYKMPNTLNAQQVMAITDETNFNSGVPAYNWKTQLGDYTWNLLQNGWQGTNWLEEMRNKNALTQNHALNLTGGSERSKFSMGLSFTSQDGIIGKGDIEPNYTRYTGRINSSHVILKGKGRDIIKLGENLTAFYSHQNTIAQTSALYNDVRNAIQASPLLPMYNAQGGLFDYTDETKTGWVFDDKDIANNPIILMNKSHGLNRTRTYGLNATVYLEVEPIKNLRWRSTVSYHMLNSTYRALTAPYQTSSNNSSTGYTVRQESSLGHNVSEENTIYYKLPKTNGHEFDFLVGQSIEKTIPGDNMKVSNSIQDGNQIPTMRPSMDYAWLSNTFGTATSNFEGYPMDEWALASFFGRINYSYKDKYMATLIVRSDGSSNFAKGHRWGTFPSVSAGWVMSEEKFMQKSRSWVDFLKLRASWGQNGNQSIPNFQYVSPVAFDLSHGYMFGDTHIQKGQLPSTGAYATNLANEDVTWEKSEQFDFGVDMVMLSSRLRLNADYYIKKTKDWLVQAPILSTAGTAAPYINGGDVENKGLEVALAWNDHVGDLQYGVSFNAAYNKNKVTRIANTEGIIHGNTGAISTDTPEFYRAQVGYPIGYFWGFKTAGVFQNQQQITDWIAAGNGVAQASPQPGDLIYQDLNHDGVINENDKTMIGNPHPDWNIGFSLNLAWRGFDFSATAAGALGQQVLFGTRANTIYAFNRWHGEGTSNRYPRLVTKAALSDHISDIDIENADYLRMQNITLGYDLKRIWKSSPLQRMRIYVTVQNLFTITGYKGMDPEVGFGGTDRYGDNATSWVTGIDLGSYPAARTWMIGANITF
jgi:tonB-linked outer membrane protein, susC/ragA family